MNIIQDTPLYCICASCAPKKLLIGNKHCLDECCNKLSTFSLYLRNDIIYFHLNQNELIIERSDLNRKEEFVHLSFYIKEEKVKLSHIYNFISLIESCADLQKLTNLNTQQINNINELTKYLKLSSFI